VRLVDIRAVHSYDFVCRGVIPNDGHLILFIWFQLNELTVKKLILRYLMVYTAVHLQTLPAPRIAQFNILCILVLLFFQTFRRIRHP
jgi:hypothetical protein